MTFLITFQLLLLAVVFKGLCSLGHLYAYRNGLIAAVGLVHIMNSYTEMFISTVQILVFSIYQ